MQVTPVRGTGKNEKRTGWSFSFYQQWSGLIGRCNWYDITLIHVGGEFAPYTNRWEIELGLLGFNVNIQYVYARCKDLDDALDEFERSVTFLNL